MLEAQEVAEEILNIVRINGEIMKILVKIFLFILLISTSLAAEPNVLRIGYQENYGVVKTPRIAGFEGYGYEYIYKILEYTKESYQIEFVECELTEGLTLLEEGEIDLLLPAAKTEDLEERFAFSQETFGREIRFLTATDPEYISSGDYRDLSNSVIAVAKNDVIIPELYQFLADNNINAQVEEIDIASYHKVLQDESYDFVVASSLLMVPDLEASFILTYYPSYFMATQENQHIIDDFDQGIGRIVAEEYMFSERTYLKYFENDYNLNAMITTSDYEFMRFKPVYQVGISDTKSPLSSVNAEGELVGIYKDILDQVAQDMGVQLNFVVLDEETTTNDLENLDFSALSFKDEARFRLVQSDPLLQIPFMLLQKTGEQEESNVGTLAYYGLGQEELSFFITVDNLIYYDSYESLGKAFDKGEVNTLVITSNTYSAFELENSDYLATYLHYSLSLSLFFHENFPKAKIEVINKFIGRLDAMDLEYIMYEHSLPEEKTATFEEILEENPIILNVFFLLIVFFIFSVLLEERSKKKALVHLLNEDAITGLLTEHCFLEQAEALFRHHPEKQYTIISVDIDNFKYINEVYGYESGTKILKEFADYLKQLEPKPLFASRISSDNFVYIMEKSFSEEEIAGLFSKDDILLTRCNKHLSSSYNFGFSLGMYESVNHNFTLNYMVDCANYARSLGKGIMGNTFFKFTEEMRKERMVSNEILSRTEHALNQHEFVMYYQPKIDLKTREITGAEALVRWIRDGSMVPPNNFIPLFEKNGFIERLDYYVLDTVCQFIAQYRARNLPRISVNLSGFSVIREELVENIMEVLDKHQVSPDEIDLEITESAFVENVDFNVEKLDYLRSLGFTISMDDFGAGISSLGRLKEIPIDVLKIDREFIVDSLENEKGATIILNIVRMAQDLKIETVAEGIELKEQLDFLESLGCDVSQGYFFSRPVNREHFLSVLKKKDF